MFKTKPALFDGIRPSYIPALRLEDIGGGQEDLDVFVDY